MAPGTCQEGYFDFSIERISTFFEAGLTYGRRKLSEGLSGLDAL